MKKKSNIMKDEKIRRPCYRRRIKIKYRLARKRRDVYEEGAVKNLVTIEGNREDVKIELCEEIEKAYNQLNKYFIREVVMGELTTKVRRDHVP